MNHRGAGVFHKVLVANRGEIARRVLRTCRALGIETVAVYSDPDADEPHVLEADEAVRLGPAPAADSYLAIERIIDAASTTGADAVHPGYGFLAENASFAAACRDAGLTFVGPSADTIRLMGDKSAAKRHLEDAGVPVIPGVHDPDLDDDALAAAANDLGFPVLVKAVAGGGGKGMRLVQSEEDLPEAIAGARREGEASFGDPRLLVEKVVERPRHVEFQILGDHAGNVVHVFERECSLQRRHQKVVEETPSPALDDDLRERMGASAVAAAQAVDYLGAGTVEMLLSDATGEFYFLEMNTRLQVEHPVTELVTGLDLVALQLRIAAGDPLPFAQDDLTSTGHAIEARLYAEDPARDYLPQTGEILAFDVPAGPGIRVDTGVADGSSVSAHYDPMLAKIVAHGEDRDTAADRLARALEHTIVLGVVTNVEFLRDVITHERFRSGKLTTAFLDEHFSGWQRPGATRDLVAAGAAAVLVATRGVAAGDDLTEGARHQDPWSGLGPWRMGGIGGWRVRLEDESGTAHDLVVGGRYPVMRITSDDTTLTTVVRDPTTLDLEVDGHAVRARVAVVRSTTGDRDPPSAVWAHVSGRHARFAVHTATRHVDPAAAAAGDVHAAPMPGTVAAVNVAEGDEVDTGQVLVVVEAMKMEHPVRAPAPSTVTALHVAVGDAVEADQPLVRLEPLTDVDGR